MPHILRLPSINCRPSAPGIWLLPPQATRIIRSSSSGRGGRERNGRRSRFGGFAAEDDANANGDGEENVGGDVGGHFGAEFGTDFGANFGTDFGADFGADCCQFVDGKIGGKVGAAAAAAAESAESGGDTGLISWVVGLLMISHFRCCFCCSAESQGCLAAEVLFWRCSLAILLLLLGSAAVELFEELLFAAAELPGREAVAEVDDWCAAAGLGDWESCIFWDSSFLWSVKAERKYN
jgi:hypothetical protein